MDVDTRARITTSRLKQQTQTQMNTKNNNSLNDVSATFKFDRQFQEKIVHAMVVDKAWASQFSEVLELDYFGYNYLKLITSNYLAYMAKYKEFPSLDLLVGILKEELKIASDTVLTEQVKTFLKTVSSNTNLGDLPYVKDQSLSWCKKMALTKALDQSLTFAENEEDYDKIVSVVQKAVSAGNTHTSGLDLSEDIDARYSETYRCTIPTGIPELDHRKILNGGLGIGELGIIVAPTGVGKTHGMISMGANALLQGKNVAHYTFELNERVVGIRYDSHLLDIDSTDCFDHRDDIKKFYEENKGKLGSLRIKYYPTTSATVNTLRNHLQKLATTGFRPDMVIVDYAGIMRSTDRSDLLRIELKKVCEELRAFSDELGCPVWTALQSNKEGANSEIIDLTNMSESYAQAAVADFVIGISRQSLQKATGFGTLFIAKNRAGMDGIKYAIHLDTARSKLRILNDHEASEFSSTSETERQEQTTAYMRKKLRGMNGGMP